MDAVILVFSDYEFNKIDFAKFDFQLNVLEFNISSYFSDDKNNQCRAKEGGQNQNFIVFHPPKVPSFPNEKCLYTPLNSTRHS